MIKPYFENGILSEKVEAITPGFVAAFSKGLARYTGDSIVQKSGMERPLAVLFSLDGSKNSEKIFSYFKDILLDFGIDAEKKLDKFDIKIEIREKDLIEMEVFENFRDGLIPIPQIAVNYIEHALNTETGLDVLK